VRPGPSAELAECVDRVRPEKRVRVLHERGDGRHRGRADLLQPVGGAVLQIAVVGLQEPDEQLDLARPCEARDAEDQKQRPHSVPS